MATKKNTADQAAKNSTPPEKNSGEGQMGLREDRDHTTGSKAGDRRKADTGGKQERKQL